MNQIIKYSIIALLAVNFIGCARINSEGFEKLPKAKDGELMAVLDSMSRQEFDYFYLKIATKYEDTTMKISFKTSIRFIDDSLLNTMITYAKIPIMNSTISPDSVIISDKREKCYIKKSTDYIKESFGVDFNFHNVEELVMGLPLGYDSTVRYYQMPSTDGYVISSHRKKDIKKNERKGMREVITTYTLSQDLKELKRVEIESPADSTTIYIDYKVHQFVEGYLLPKEVDVLVVTPSQEIIVELIYKKARVNEVETIHFVIPEKFGPCE